MACPYCATDEDWFKLADGRSRCPGCFATTDAEGAEKAAKKELKSRDSTDKTTTAPSRVADDIKP